MSHVDAIDELVDWQMGNNPDPGLLAVDMTVTRGQQVFTLGSDGWWRNQLGHIPANSEAWKMLDDIH